MAARAPNGRAGWSVFLETERLILRRFTEDDVDLLVALDSDCEVMRYISRGQPTPRNAMVEDILPRMLAWYEQGNNAGYWAAHKRSTGVFVGWFHMRPARLLPDAQELGYRLSRAYWGRGFATEGARALLHRTFSLGAVPHITSTTLVGNHASQRVMQKAGLTYREHFTYPALLLPGWSAAERAAVRCGADRADWLAWAAQTP